MIKKVFKMNDKQIKVDTMMGRLIVRSYYLHKRKKMNYFYYENVTVFFNFDSEGKSERFYQYNKVTKKMDPLEVAGVIDSTKNNIITAIKTGVTKHKEYETIKTCIENDIPVYLHGPAGSGKNFTLQDISEDLGLEFFFTNSVQQEFKVTGFIDAGGNFHETEFYKAFKNGGLFFLDEMDASIPEVLVLLNAAIANRYFEFPNGRIDAHENFRVVAAGNTVGTGADEQYTGRLELDQATLDRFVAIEFDYDKNIELLISGGNKELVDFVRDIRKQATDKGVRSTFSYRAIMATDKLEKTGTITLTKILTIAVFKGMDKDTINTFRTNKVNKYSRHLWSLQNMKASS